MIRKKSKNIFCCFNVPSFFPVEKHPRGRFVATWDPSPRVIKNNSDLFSIKLSFSAEEILRNKVLQKTACLVSSWIRYWKRHVSAQAQRETVTCQLMGPLFHSVYPPVTIYNFLWKCLAPCRESPASSLFNLSVQNGRALKTSVCQHGTVKNCMTVLKISLP